MCKEIRYDEIVDHRSAFDPANDSEAVGGLFQGLHEASAIAQHAPRGSGPLGAFADLVLAWRSKIDAIFGHQGFAASPAWDIMLGLYQAQATGASFTVSDVADLSPCSRPIAIRWVSALEKMQLVETLEPTPGSMDPIVSLADQGLLKTEMALRLRL